MNNCDIIKGTSYILFTCIETTLTQEGATWKEGEKAGETEREKGNLQFCIFHPLWKVDTVQTKVSVLTQILADSAYQPSLYFAHCGANLLFHQ